VILEFVRAKLHKIKSLGPINGAIERNEKSENQIEFWPNS
jgi:hypothetical protein